MAIKFKNVPQLHKVGERFTKYFNLPFKDFYDHKLSTLVMKIKFDMDKFDDYLELKHQMNTKEQSMADCIERHYGKDALDFIKKLL